MLLISFCLFFRDCRQNCRQLCRQFRPHTPPSTPHFSSNPLSQIVTSNPKLQPDTHFAVDMFPYKKTELFSEVRLYIPTSEKARKYAAFWHLFIFSWHQDYRLDMRWDDWTALFFTSSVCGNMSSASSVCGNLSIVTVSALHQQTRIEISSIPSNLLTVIFCY